MLEPQADRVRTLEEWEEYWQKDNIGFHIDHSNLKCVCHPIMLLLLSVAVRLADRGHSVVGVEISEKAVRQFFEENNMTYSEEAAAGVPGAKVFKSSEKSISLYQCDLYDFSSSVEGQFGAIWDRGSLVAVNPQDREKYAALMVSLMAKDCRYLVDNLLYNPTLYKGPPFFVPDEQLHSLFGHCCNIELLQAADALTDRTRKWGLDYLTEKVHLLTPKS
uniref:thiopurine S-methyltransferase n=1 Tax=Acanthochromis polyacanthus TaxID=80966 RepID=A0A3Q1FXA9_9TELE